LIFDASGNLYGTTDGGGSGGYGTVFELSPQSGGSWFETVLHSFTGKTDGAEPIAGVILDTTGNLYGTTWAGGSGACDNGNVKGCGTVFDLSPQSGGGWSEQVLYSFRSKGNDGNNPYSSLIFDSAGNLYGTTSDGGSDKCKYGCGTVFELSPQQGSGWSETVLHHFQGSGSDGEAPYGSLTLNKEGHLFGTTCLGGALLHGSIFELSPKSGGGWHETMLHSFRLDGDGRFPYAGLILDKSGNLFGTTSTGGSGNCGNNGCGTISRIARQSGGRWAENVLYSFNPKGQPSGSFPLAGLALDANGNFYGTTSGGNEYTSGTVFELSPVTAKPTR
jgi:uncharacterized repeat protein (TIGR03803 family)